VTRTAFVLRDVLAAVAIVLMQGPVLALCLLVVLLVAALAVTGAVQRRRERRAKAVVRQAYEDAVTANASVLLPAQREPRP
jgi:hypothetical protein